jgi:hypothetical protein
LAHGHHSWNHPRQHKEKEKEEHFLKNMATFSLGGGVTPGAPGVYINERAGNIASAAVADFSTTYLLVEAPENASTTVFPFNTPVAITSLADYKVLVGGTVPTGRITELSYNVVDTFFKNAQVGDLRVVRVGTPNQIVEIEIFPSGDKIGTSGLPTSLSAGDVVYAQIVLNGTRLVAGDGSTGYSAEGEWLGVPVTIPVDYVSGDEANNRRISRAIVTAIAGAIESNPSVASSIYVRSFGLVVDIDPTSNSQNGFINVAATTFDGTVSVVTQVNPVGSIQVLTQSTYDIQNIVGLQQNAVRVPQDYIQTLNTAFDGQRSQGYVITPTAYAQFDEIGRAAVGAAATALAANNNFKWMHLADCGPFYVTDINAYGTFTPHEPAEDLTTGNKYLVDNAIYEWVGADVTYPRLNYQTLVGGYSGLPAVSSSVNTVADGEKVGLLDSADFTFTSSVGEANLGRFVVSGNIWPVDYQIQEVTLTDKGADFAGLPDSVFVIAPPLDIAVSGPYSGYVYIAETAAEATAILTEVLVSGGSANQLTAPTGAFVVASPTGSTVAATYTTPAWNLPVDINGQTSNLIENVSGASAGVNTLHLPGTLQDPTDTYRLGFVSRTLFNPASQVSTGTGTYAGKAVFEVIGHGLQTGYKVFFTQPVLDGSATFLAKSNRNAVQAYYVKVIDADTFVLANSLSNFSAGAYLSAPTGSLSTKPTVLYTPTLGGSTTSVNLSELATVSLIRARKYGFASGTIASQAADASAAPAPSGDAPAVSIYLNNSRTVLGAEQIFPYGEDPGADWLAYLSLVNPGSSTTTTANFITTPTVDQSYASEAYLVPSLDAIFGGYYDPTGGGALSGASDYVVSAGLTNGDNATDLQAAIAYLDGVYFNVSDPGFAPDGTTAVVDGDRIAVVFNGTTFGWVVVPAASLGGDLSSVGRVLYGAQVELALTPEQTPPANLWRFDAVTSTEIIDQALRGVGFNGEPQAVFIEAGVDNVTRLYDDSQRYYNPQGFVAFYGPYIQNSAGQFIPESPYVTGVALRRYRAEGYQFPPAGVKYQLSDAVGTQIPVNSSQQNLLNPAGCNVSRSLPGYPDTAVFIWGGRTRINPDDAQQRLYQFVNTRVIMNVVYGSLRNAFDSQIFSVIDGFGVVYNQIVSVGNSVLSQLYTSGALFGRRPSDAFQVICDERINTADSLENGIVNVKVFVTPVPTLERIQIDLIRVAIGQMTRELESQGLGG